MLNKSTKLRDFELNIVKEFKTFTVKEGGGKSRPRKGVWIRGHLVDVGEDYVYGMFKRWLEFCKAALLEFHAELEPGDYTAFKTYMYLLRKYGLVLPTRTERGKSTVILRIYYKVNRARLRDPMWLNPFAEYPSWQAQRKKGFPKKRRKPRKRGRKPKYHI
jgi:hypothetical protein